MQDNYLKSLLVVADTNVIWRRKPFQALSAYFPVLGLGPRGIRSAWKQERWPFRRGSLEQLQPEFYRLPMVMPPGWMSERGRKAQARIWNAVDRFSQAHKKNVDYLVVTVPQYLPLLEITPPRVKTAYYVSDDYRNTGWDSDTIVKLESAVMRRVDHVLFVSRVLAQRAITEYPELEAKIRVSMNATESSFLAAEHVGICAPPVPYNTLKRPIVGVVGKINDHLDLELLLTCANLPRVGTLLFVGPVSRKSSPILKQLQEHPKCVFVGEQPHEQLPEWTLCLDIALIPYRSSPFNNARSPMRLFDHMASGRPIVATNNCDQVNEFAHVVRLCANHGEFTAAVNEESEDPRPTARVLEQLAVAQENTWEHRASELYSLLKANETVEGASSSA